MAYPTLPGGDIPGIPPAALAALTNINPRPVDTSFEQFQAAQSQVIVDSLDMQAGYATVGGVRVPAVLLRPCQSKQPGVAYPTYVLVVSPGQLRRLKLLVRDCVNKALKLVGAKP